MFGKLREILSISSASPAAKAPKEQPRRSSLSLEFLEDRLVPAAMTFVVTNLNDSASAVANDGSLRGAILAANANIDAAPDTIQFASGLAGTITLTAGELDITDSVKIVGSDLPAWRSAEPTPRVSSTLTEVEPSKSCSPA